MNGSASRPNSATMNGTRCAIRPATKATSRESRSSFDPGRCTGRCKQRRGRPRAASGCHARRGSGLGQPCPAGTLEPQLVRSAVTLQRGFQDFVHPGHGAGWLYCAQLGDAFARFFRAAQQAACAHPHSRTLRIGREQAECPHRVVRVLDLSVPKVSQATAFQCTWCETSSGLRRWAFSK